MTKVYRPRHPEKTVLYRVLFHHFERFVPECEELFDQMEITIPGKSERGKKKRGAGG